MSQDSVLSMDLITRLLTIATRAASEQDRDRLTHVFCQEVSDAVGAQWTALAHIDDDGALVAMLGCRSARKGALIAGPSQVAASGLPSSTKPVRLPAHDDEGLSLDAVVIDADRADAGVIVVARSEHDQRDATQVEQFLISLAQIIAGAFERIRITSEIAANEHRLAEAQRLANLGSYDWHIPSDTNTWSDELYRIYGHEPGAFNASYERFLEMIHPDDRERIMAVHAKAMEDHQPYRMEERIVRPDGELRYLDSTGMVVLDEKGRPERMVGICLDITEQHRAATALHRSEERFRTLIESAPDAVLLFNAAGEIVQANRETERLFGWSAEDLHAVRVDTMLPEIRRPLDLSGDLVGHRRDGSTVIVSVRLARVETDDGVATAAFVRDATERRRAAEATQRLVQAEERRRQALEINDNVIQGLTTVLGSLEMGWSAEALAAARTTLAAASAMMSELLEVSGDGLHAGELQRDHPTPTHLPHVLPANSASTVEARMSVVLADDSADLRALYRLMLGRHGIRVIAEAADGEEALAMALTHQPDVLVVDLAMPVMDGMQVAAALKAQWPESKVVMLSGFEESRVGELARAAGVDRYLSKGIDGDALADALFEMGPPSKRATPTQPA